MASERETRTEQDIWGNDHEYIYENGKRVGEFKIEDRGGFLGIGDERHKVEYDADGRETGYSRREGRGGFLGIGEEQVEAGYDRDGNRLGYSHVEERGGFLGIGSHHERIGYDEDGNEVSSTQTERRGGFLRIGERRVRVTRYSDREDESRDEYRRSSSGKDSDLTEALIKLGIGLAVVFFVVWLVFAVILPLAIVDAAALALGVATVSPNRRNILLPVSALGAVYVLLDYNLGWLTQSLVRTAPFLNGWMSGLVYANVAAGLISAYMLLQPVVEKALPVEEEHRTRQQLILAACLLAAGCGIFLAQRRVDLRWQQRLLAAAGFPTTGSPDNAAAGDTAVFVDSAPSNPPARVARPQAETRNASLGTPSANVAPARTVQTASVPKARREARPRPTVQVAAAPAAPPTIACVLPGGQEARLTAERCESAGGMEYR